MKVIAGIALLVLAIIVRGFAISLMWGWLIVPVFHAPNLTLMQGAGLSLMVSTFVYQETPNDTRSYWERLSTGIIQAVVLLGCAWIYSFFI